MKTVATASVMNGQRPSTKIRVSCSKVWVNTATRPRHMFSRSATYGVPRRGWTAPTERKKRPSLAMAYQTRGLAMIDPLSAPKVDNMTSAATNAAPRDPSGPVAAVDATSVDFAIAGRGNTYRYAALMIKYTGTMIAMPAKSARGYVRTGSFTSPATYVNSIQPVYVQSTAMSAVKKLDAVTPLQVIGWAIAPCERSPRAKISTASIASASTFATVDAVCSVTPHGTDRTFAAVNVTTSAPATMCTWPSVRGAKARAYSAKISARAASLAGPVTSILTQP